MNELDSFNGAILSQLSRVGSGIHLIDEDSSKESNAELANAIYEMTKVDKIKVGKYKNDR